ncbi:MAG: MBL fold metallo-hydrolase [Simkaniaceae bacterium]|nr:MBL fold metallo-hydrolase [Simkaniaceae bacterium]
MQAKKRILVVDSSSSFLASVMAAEEATRYDISCVESGSDCVAKLDTFRPHLVVIDLTVSHVHGIEVLKVIRADWPTGSMGVIITSHHVMIQNYHAALLGGVDYFIFKPFEMSVLFELIDRYFQGELRPDPFQGKTGKEAAQQYCYHPVVSTATSYIRLWGTRGSSPVAGPRYVCFGGNTSCLEVRHGDDLIIIDAGTGIRELGERRDVRERETIHLFLSHTHWDHITGVPFFAPFYKKECTVVVRAPVGFEKSTKELFNEMLAYAYFPVRLDEMKARVLFKELRDDRPISVGDILVETHFTNHPGATLGFKITVPGKTIGYVTDNEVLLGYYGHPDPIHEKHPRLEPHLSLISFLKGCDLIVHEAQYFPDEYHVKTGWGHSSISNATVLLRHTECGEWIVTHHDPNHSDHDLRIKKRLHEDILQECGLPIRVDIAYDGMVLPF